MNPGSARSRAGIYGLSGLVTGILGISYFWASWNLDAPVWPRYLWVAVCAGLVAAPAHPAFRRAVHWLRRRALDLLPGIWLGAFAVGAALSFLQWPMLTHWHATEKTLLGEMLARPSKLATNWYLYVQLKRHAGDHPVTLGGADLFAPFIPEMLQLQTTPGAPPRLTEADWKRLEMSRHQHYRLIRTYLPEEVREDYQFVASNQPEHYYALRGPRNEIWLLPESSLPAQGEPH